MGIQKFLYKYNRNEITTGILHFGVGNFHRAHQAYYTSFINLRRYEFVKVISFKNYIDGTKK